MSTATPGTRASRHWPLLSLALGALAASLMLLSPAAQALLYFDVMSLKQGLPLGLVTAHWVHADGVHLAWNLVALCALGAIIEAHSRALLVRSLIAGTLCVDLLLLSPLSDLQRYCGLSGVLNTLFGVVLILYWQRSRSPTVIIVACLGAIKIALEIHTGQAVFTQVSWPPFAPAHLAGLVGAPVAVCCTRERRTRWPRLPPPRSEHGDLVPGE